MIETFKLIKIILIQNIKTLQI